VFLVGAVSLRGQILLFASHPWTCSDPLGSFLHTHQFRGRAEPERDAEHRHTWGAKLQTHSDL